MSEWIAWFGHVRPVPTGTVVDVKLRNGRVLLGVVCGKDAATLCGDVVAATNDNGEAWACFGWPNDIIAYRLHDNGEQAKREARIASLRKMAQPNNYDVRPIKVPEREKVKQ